MYFKNNALIYINHIDILPYGLNVYTNTMFWICIFSSRDIYLSNIKTGHYSVLALQSNVRTRKEVSAARF